jgi:alcohol dehydrogenase
MREGAIDTSGGAPVVRPVTLIHVPTTLSAGEYTNGAGMVGTTGKGKIISLDDRHLAWSVILDPTLTVATPGALWASSGIKAIDHAAEAIWGTASHPLGDALAMAGLQRLIRYLPRTVTEPLDLEFRLECQIGAWMSIASMRNTGLELSHLVEHAIGSYWNLPHGITSCVGLAPSMALLARKYPAKVAAVARGFGIEAAPNASDEEVGLAGARWLQQWIAGLGLPIRLCEIVDDYDALDEIADIALHELQFFDRIPNGGHNAVRELLEMIWHGQTVQRNHANFF